MDDTFHIWLLVGIFSTLGACIGSFLNVAIYRIPLGISVNKPSRSFCTTCKKDIPWYHNIPLLSWVVLGGKSACCRQPISFRYWAVEALTACLFGLATYWSQIAFFDFSILAVLLLCLWIGFAITISFIDAENMIVFTSQTLWAGVIGLALSIIYPSIVQEYSWRDGLYASLLGGLVAWVLIRLIIELGKLAFGKWKRSYEVPTAWSLVEPQQENEELRFLLDGEHHDWSMLFHRSSDRAILTKGEISIDGKKPIPFDTLLIYEDRLAIPDKQTWRIEDIQSAKGSLTHIEAKREAMGSGDAWILMSIGLCFGWQGAVFSLACAAFLGIGFALINRLGLGRPLPFGPLLYLGSGIWFFGGFILWHWYFNFIAI